MNRINFLKKVFSFTAAATVAPNLLVANKKPTLEKFSFDDLFITHKGNNRLIYPKKESVFYKQIKQSFEDRIDLKSGHTYLPVHHLSIQVKDYYEWEDFLPVKYYFECVYGKMQKYTTEGYEVCYRFIKDEPDRMHLEVFLAYSY